MEVINTNSKNIKDRIDKYFQISERGSSFKIEVFSGITTFLSVAYALLVVPSILRDGGVPFGPAFTACVLITFIGTLLAGIYANYPVVMIASIGTNALLAYNVSTMSGYSWQIGMAAVFVAGIIFVILATTGVREAVVNAIPKDLQYAVISGIGLFIAFIGLQNSGLVVSGPNLVTLGNLFTKESMLVVFGVILLSMLVVKGYNYAIIISIIISAIIGMIIGVVDMPTKIFAMPPSANEVIFASVSHIPELLNPSMIVLIFSILFTNFFDSLGTLLAVGHKSGLVKDGKLSGSKKAMVVDAASSVIGGLIGSGATTTALESLIGISSGAKTGLSSVVAAIMCILTLFISPLIGVMNDYITAPVLIVLGAMMCSNLTKIRFDKIEYAIPAFLTVMLMPLIFSITEGMAIGFLFYTVTMIAKGKIKDISFIMWCLNVVFILYFLLS